MPVRSGNWWKPCTPSCTLSRSASFGASEPTALFSARRSLTKPICDWLRQPSGSGRIGPTSSGLPPTSCAASWWITLAPSGPRNAEAALLTVSLSDCYSAAQAPAVDVLDIHEAMEEMEKTHSGQSQVVELRYFGGFSIEEVAEIMGVSASTVKREWIVAKTWIHRRMLGRQARP